MTGDEWRRLFARARVARLATVDAAGRPHLVPLAFAVAGNEIFSAVDAKPKRTTRLRRLENVRANPQVALLADHYDDLRARGQTLISLRGIRAEEPWMLPGVKSTSYAVNMAAEAEARRRGADDAVFVDASGIVLEGPTTNIWWRREHTLFTPSLDLGILAGVTRATVIELAGDTGYDVEEGTYDLVELQAADEAFTSSSVREVMPVTVLDDGPIAHGTAADELQAALRQAAGATLAT